MAYYSQDLPIPSISARERSRDRDRSLHWGLGIKICDLPDRIEPYKSTTQIGTITEIIESFPKPTIQIESFMLNRQIHLNLPFGLYHPQFSMDNP